MLINDNYGHDVGNKIIQKISTRLKRFIHEDEHVSYWGGDKFNLILKPKQINSMDSIVIDIMKAIKTAMPTTNRTWNIRPRVRSFVHKLLVFILTSYSIQLMWITLPLTPLK